MQCQKLKTYMETGRVVFLPARSIRPNPAQPRKIFRPEALDELSDSIRQHGILQPLSVRRSGNGYELIAGERRLRAAELAGITDIPCIIMSMDDRESGMAAMVENLQRQDLDFIEEAMGISRLLEDWNMSQEQAARLLGRQHTHRHGNICNRVVPYYICHMIDFLNLLFQFRYIFLFHTINNEHRKCSGSKIIHQNILSFHRLDIVWKISQHIIIDPGIQITED